MTRPATDLTDRRFGKWRVSAVKESRNSGAYWFCQCDCGTTKMVRATELVQGRSLSCGCSRLSRAHKPPPPPKTVIVHYRYRFSAKQPFSRWFYFRTVSEQQAAQLVKITGNVQYEVAS